MWQKEEKGNLLRQNPLKNGLFLIGIVLSGEFVGGNRRGDVASAVK